VIGDGRKDTTKLTKPESGTKDTKKRSFDFVYFVPFGVIVSRVSWLRSSALTDRATMSS